MTTTEVNARPTCDFCTNSADYHASTQTGYWAHMCDYHMVSVGAGSRAESGPQTVPGVNHNGWGIKDLRLSLQFSVEGTIYLK